MLQAGLIGDPVSHSLSRVMHNAAFAHLGIDADYALWQTPLADLEARVRSLREPGILGANVTVPHKQAVVPFLDDLGTSAHRVGAVNTIIPTDGRLVGENTDAYGFARSLSDATSNTPLSRAIVIGAGGASRAVLVALQDAGVTSITLANRTLARAEDLAADLVTPDAAAIAPCALDDVLERAAGADVLINATSVGWHGEELPVDTAVLDRLAPGAVVVDLTYRETPILKLARERGLAILDGLPMLIHQGARSFELWTGHAAPVDVMMAAAIEEQARRAMS